MTLAVERAQARNPDTIENLRKNLDELYKQVPELLTVLEEDFQRILGLDERMRNGDLKSSSSEPR